MKAADYRGWLERRELTHEAAGRALGVHKSTSKRYGDGSIRSPCRSSSPSRRWKRDGGAAAGGARARLSLPAQPEAIMAWQGIQYQF